MKADTRSESRGARSRVTSPSSNSWKLSLEQEAVRQQVAHACRILATLDLDSCPFATVSARIPGLNETWQSPASISFDRMTPEDILRLDAHGNGIEGRHYPSAESALHREIYRSRPDLGAIVHVRSEDTVVLSLHGTKVEPFTQYGMSMMEDQGFYDAKPCLEADERSNIARALGKHRFLILRNHGILSTGRCLPEALWDRVVAERACRAQLSAMKVGLKAGTVESTLARQMRYEVRESQVQPMWRNFLARVGDAGGGVVH